jgi:N-acetylneuraminate synthase
MIEIAGHPIGAGHPVFIIAEIGINHNGSVDIAKRLIDAAKDAGADAVKFQKRTPRVCVPRDQWDIVKDTPFGRMSYIDYKERIEFGQDEYEQIDAYCKRVGMIWFASCWDVPSVDFIEQFNPPCYKIASASLTNAALLMNLYYQNVPVLLSTGMSSWHEIRAAINLIGRHNKTIILHARSTYPAALDELNLNMIKTLQERYGVPVGYSGHESGLATTVAAVALGACVIERHLTLDRAMVGTDHAASVEPHGFARLVKDIRSIEQALGDGQQREYASEIPVRAKLRGKYAKQSV